PLHQRFRHLVPLSLTVIILSEQQAAAALRQIHRAAALVLAAVDDPVLRSGELAAFRAERARIASLVGIAPALALPRSRERHLAVLADLAFAGLHPDAGRAILVEHSVAIAGNAAGDL